jgi:lauroyl/myristoyl acyltransferase
MLHSRMLAPSTAPPSTHPALAPATPAQASATPAWLGTFFQLAHAFPALARAIKPAACAFTPLALPSLRHATARNAHRILGRELSPPEQRDFARRVVASFYGFVLDLARASDMTAAALAAQVTHVEGLDDYRRARAARRGTILVTAHLGTFETGLAALAREERAVRVVFKRDGVAPFERMRARLHATLGIIESPIDDGIDTWLALRDALLRDEVVVMQGDRAMPGQKSELVPFLHGHLHLPTGPVRLARLTGAPIIPVFALRPSPTSGVHVLLKPPIDAAGDQFALHALASAIADVVARHPHQWLSLGAMFHEDRP